MTDIKGEIGSIFGAPVIIKNIFETRYGWARNVPFTMDRVRLLEVLAKACPPSIRAIMPKQEPIKEETEISMPEPMILVGDIERVEIKIYFKER